MSVDGHMTCTGMWASFVRIGMMETITLPDRRLTRSVRLLARTARFAEAVVSKSPIGAVRRDAQGSARIDRLPTWVSALPPFQRAGRPGGVESAKEQASSGAEEAIETAKQTTAKRPDFS